VDECKPLLYGIKLSSKKYQSTVALRITVIGEAHLRQGLTLAHFKAQLEDLRDTSLTLELKLSTFGTHPRLTWGYAGDTVSLS